MRYVVCAALRLNDNIIIGPRHFDDTMRRQIEARSDNLAWAQSEQGFIDQFGIFMTRTEAWDVAVEADQFKRILPGVAGKLYSENLY